MEQSVDQKRKMKTTKELQELGWLARSTAEQNYLQNPLLKELFPTYDDYASYNYQHCRGKWNTGSRSVFALEGRGTHVQAYSEGSEAQPGALGEVLSELTEGIPLGNPEHSLSKQEFLSIGPDKYSTVGSNIKVKKLKYKGKKEDYASAGSNTRCPCCLSKLVVNEFSIWQCSGDRLKEWERDFLIYNKLNDEEKKKYLLMIQDVNMFNDLYEKWNTIDSKTGFRAGFECGYTNRLFNPVTRFRTSLPDPVLVKKIERSLGRALTEEEKHGESDIWLKEGIYSIKYKRGAKKVKIPQIVFPDAIV